MSEEPRTPRDTSQVTLKDIAEIAGVHVSTVSRALRRAGSGPTRSRSSDERILKLARDLGYTPNFNAASMTTKRSTAFGVVVPQLTDVVLSYMYDAIEGAANRSGYDTFVSNTHDDPAEQRRRIESLLGRRVDGLILGDAHLDGTNLDELDRRRISHVLISRRCPGHLSVCGDDYGGGLLVGRHLAALGHTDVAILAGPDWASTSVDRVKGCLDGLAEAGIELPPDRVLSVGFDSDDGYQVAGRLLAGQKIPTAMFAVNDFTAIGATGAIRESGMRPGRDIAVVGYNDIPVACRLETPLTTVRSPFHEIGVRAVETLLSTLHGLPTSPTVLPVNLVVRESTVPA